MDVPHETTKLTIEAAVEDSNATLDISAVGDIDLTDGIVSNLKVADNTVKFTVTAEGGTKQIYLRKYTWTVYTYSRRNDVGLWFDYRSVYCKHCGTS